MTVTIDSLAAASVLPGTDFDIDEWLSGLDLELLATSEGRRVLTECDPLLFAVVYLGNHLLTDGQLSLSDFHLDLVEQAKRWMIPNRAPGACRDAYIAPREAGKSSWLFTILPLWAAAHGYVKFIAAFADSAPQAEQHLRTFKTELDNNELLRTDYPDLCAPGMRPGGVNQSDNQSLMISRSGFVFSARGIDTAVLGLKVGKARPDLIILDDIERDEARYSAKGVQKRLSTVLEAILPLSVTARVVLAGTATMPGSIIHQLVKSVTTTEKPEQWIPDNNFKTHYYPAIVSNPDGTERSLWPAKWPLSFLQSIRHTRAYRKNYANDPMGTNGDYWTLESFTYKELEGVATTYLVVDPAVTSKATSDETGIAIVGYSPLAKKIEVSYAAGVRMTPARLRKRCIQLIEANPHITRLIVESNQGGETWGPVFHNFPVPVICVHHSDGKQVRAARILNDYELGRIVHRGRLATLEEQMVVFPNGLHDDVMDAVMTGIEELKSQHGGKRKGSSIQSGSYL